MNNRQDPLYPSVFPKYQICSRCSRNRKGENVRAKLVVLLGMVLIMAVTVVAPASAQGGISGPLKEVVTKGVIRELDVECNECARHAITDEVSGTSYDLVSDPRAPAGGVDLRLYVGQQVTIHGVPQLVGPPNLLFVTRVEPAPTPGGGTLPSTGGPSLLLPIIALILGTGIMGAAVLRRSW